MAQLQQVEPILRACLTNAERFINSARSVASLPACGHIAYNLAVLGLEEIGKAILIFQGTLDPLPPPREEDDERRNPIDWLEDHERKLFWAILTPVLGDELDWRKIPECLNLANGIHERRLRVLYFDPSNPGAQSEVTQEDADSVIRLAEARLKMEQLKTYSELSGEDKSDLQWFFAASRDPQLKPFIFSKGSLEKLAEFAQDRNGWFKWLRRTVEESQRTAQETAQREIIRTPAEGQEVYADKWRFKIRLRSWSHSIRANQLIEWNQNIEKIKLSRGAESNELIVELTMPKSIMLKDVWPAGMHNCVIFVASLNIATFGFFWWYLPKFISRFHEIITDLESGCAVEIDRTPQLKIVWPHQALKKDLLEQNLGAIYGFIARARDEKFQVFHKYFGVLGLMAKNDIFFQFEHHLVHDFFECFEMALKAYGDWNGDPLTFESVAAGLFQGKTGNDEFVAMVLESRKLAEDVEARKIERPITLEDVAKAKIIFDTYIHFKAYSHLRGEIEKGNIVPDAGSASSHG